MLVVAHPDDEGIFFGGAITHYSCIRKLPVVVITMTAASWIPAYKDEMLCAARIYGVPYEPIFAGFPDCCYGEDESCGWTCWGGRSGAVEYLTRQIRRYQPDVVLMHDINGEYGHPNHLTTAAATAEACTLAGDPGQFPDQLSDVTVWQPLKVYQHLYPDNVLFHDWSAPSDALGGKSSGEVTNEGLACYVSQGLRTMDTTNYDCRRWGLSYTRVGPDMGSRNDFFENVDTTAYSGIPDVLPGIDPEPEVTICPNPFTSIAEIRIINAAVRSLAIYNALGDIVAAPETGGKVLWNGRDFSGDQVPSGMYFVCIDGKEYRIVRRLVKRSKRQ